MAGEAVPILRRVSGRSMPALLTSSVQAALIEVGHVQRGAHDVADALAILDRDQRAIRPVGHDLHGRALPAEHRTRTIS